MARARGDKNYSIPMGGLNTESSLLEFPEDALFDVNNVELVFNPLSLKPRLGHSSTVILPTQTPSTTTLAADGPSSISYYLWEKAGGSQTANILCVHNGSHIIFLNANNTEVDLAIFGKLDLEDLNSETTVGSYVQATKALVQFTRAKDHLVIVSEAIDPVIITFNPVANSIEVNKLSIKVRDTVGLESGISVDKRPVLITDFPAGVVASSTYTPLSEEHEYNLYNQGWYYQRRLTAGSKTVSDPIDEFFTSTAEYPSNADIVHIGMAIDGGDLIFDADFLKDQTFGSTPTARGHYVLDAFDMNRAAIIADPQDSGAFTGGGNGVLNPDWELITLDIL